MSWVAIVKCENGHETTVNVVRPTVTDGALTHGYMGSAADFCDVCDGNIVETLGAKETS